MQMFNAEYLQEKWAPILDYSGLDEIKDSHRRSVTAILLENQEKELREAREFLYEAPTNFTASGAGAAGFGGSAQGFSAGPTAGFDPVLISLIRRSMPNLIAYDLCGVQPMNGPTGLIFAMRSRYTSQGGTEAFYNEADTRFSAQNAEGTLASGSVGFGTTASSVGQNNPSVLNDTPTAGTWQPAGCCSTVSTPPRDTQQRRSSSTR